MLHLMERLRRYRNLVLILLSGLLVPVIVNLASSWLEATIGQTPSRLLQLLALGVAVIVGLWVLILALDIEEPVELVPTEERPERHPGLIVLVGTGRQDTEPEDLSHEPAIEYHLEHEQAGGQPLKVCWLVATRGITGSLPVAEKVCSRYEKRCDVHLRTLSDPFSVDEAYRLVRRIYNQEAAANQLAPEQIIADFTGGTKPMSAGVILACQDQWPMQYMYGRKGEVASTPILVRFRRSEIPPEA